MGKVTKTVSRKSLHDLIDAYCEGDRFSSEHLGDLINELVELDMTLSYGSIAEYEDAMNKIYKLDEELV